MSPFFFWYFFICELVYFFRTARNMNTNILLAWENFYFCFLQGQPGGRGLYPAPSRPKLFMSEGDSTSCFASQCVNRLVTWCCLVLQQLPMAVRHYVGGLTRAWISVGQHGARAALERHLTSILKISVPNLLGRPTVYSYNPLDGLRHRRWLSRNSLPPCGICGSSSGDYTGMWRRVVWRTKSPSSLEKGRVLCLKMQYGTSNT
jgi:hypothetical protein